MMHILKRFLIGLTALTFVPVVNAQYHKYDVWEENYTVQALLGAVQYEGLKFDAPDSEGQTEVDVSLLPQLGGAWSTLPDEHDRLQFGLECSFLLGFRFDKINYAYLGGNGAYISLSTSMWMVDFAGGPYANIFLDKDHKIRLYGAAGPLMVFSSYRSNSEYSDNSSPEQNQTESAFGIGVYARTGLEFRIHARGSLGVGARFTWNNIDFTSIGGTSDLQGTAAFVSYTAGF